MKKRVIVIGGATATGKTNVAIKLAKEINGEIISADSMQVYKKMNIGTAKPTLEELNEIKHYMIDELYPDEPFSVAVFKERAKEYLNNIFEKGKIPIIAGGTGFYINAILNDNDFTKTETDYTYRNELYNLAQEKGNEFVYDMLKKIDEKSASQIHCNNIKRVIRALEFYKLTGKMISVHNIEEKQKKSPYEVDFILLNMDREKLYERINIRVDEMIKAGLIDEVKGLIDEGYSPSLVSMQGIGYKEVAMYLNNEITLEQCIEKIKQGTRRFAKRQITWFKNQTNGVWIDINGVNNIKDILDDLASSRQNFL